MKRAVFTVIAKNYLAHARALMESVRLTAPDVERFVVLVDEPEGRFDPSREDFTVLQSKDLPLPSPAWFHFKYTILELSTAVKPFAARELIERHGIERLIYLDPDIYCYRSVDAIFERLDDANILLTPHLTDPIDDSYRPDEIDILRSGVHNLGFIAMRRSRSTEGFLEWWRARLRDKCVVSPDQGLFVDQRWIDLAPGLFDGVRIVRDPGWNAAYWNLHERPITFDGDVPEIRGSPLLFFHFSGFDPRRPQVFSKHQNRYMTRDLGEGAALVGDYKDALLRHGFSKCCDWPYTWSRFSDGEPFPDVIRPIAFTRPQISSQVDDPFSEQGKRAIAGEWNVAATAPSGEPSNISRIALRVWETTPGIRAEMPDVFGAHEEQYRKWFAGDGRVVHELPNALVEAEPSYASVDGVPEPTWLTTLTARVPGLEQRLHRNGRAAPAWSPEYEEAIARKLAEPQPAPDWLAPPELVADCVLAARSDLQARARRDGRFDEGWYRAWLLTYGRREYRLPPALAAALEKSWGRFLASAPLMEGLKARGHRAALEVSARRNAAPASPLPRTEGVIAPHPVTARKPFRVKRAAVARQFGVNLVGQFGTPSGIGEAARLSRSALEAAKVPLSLHTVPDDPNRRDGSRFALPSGSPRYAFDLVHANADRIEASVENALGPFHDPSVTIGFWFWELEEFPKRFDAGFRFCSEVWVASEFCRRSIGVRAPTPVIAMPLPVRSEIDARDGRDSFSIEPDRFVFLCMADMLSVPERKNPLGTVEAFLRAAPKMPGAELIVKLSNPCGNEAAMSALREAAAKGPVRIVDETLSRQRVDSLIACSDCMVSLHRSEGYGLVMAEAMTAGKPVIATAYSGNMDFMDSASAFLVDYDLGCVPPGCEPYRAGAIWAEPSMNSAAAQMEKVFTDPALRASVAKAGRRRVREQLHPVATGRRMLERLRILHKRRASSA